MATFRSLVLGAAVGIAGCAPDPGPATASVSSAISGCGFGCGDNGGEINGTPFWGLWLSGAANDEQVRYLRFARNLFDMKHGVYAQLDVDGGRLRVWSGTTWQYGPLALENGILLLVVAGMPFYVKIAHVHSGIVAGTDIGEKFWTRTSTPRAETYQFQWAPLNGPVDANGEPRYQEVCAYTQLDSDQWQNQIDAVVFEGEKYDLATKRISHTTTRDFAAWFNVACEGSLPAKMFLTRRTDASSDGAVYTSTIDNDRQAMVRAWAAQYCGSETSFTHTGHKLMIRDRMPFLREEGWLPRDHPLGFTEADKTTAGFAFEAVWNASGAVCLETPRLAVDDPNVDPDPKIEDRILDACKERPPRCSEQSWFPLAWAEHGQFLTATLIEP